MLQKLSPRVHPDLRFPDPQLDLGQQGVREIIEWDEGIKGVETGEGRERKGKEGRGMNLAPDL